MGSGPIISYIRHYYIAESSFTHRFYDSNAIPVATGSLRLVHSAQRTANGEMMVDGSRTQTAGDLLYSAQIIEMVIEVRWNSIQTTIYVQLYH